MIGPKKPLKKAPPGKALGPMGETRTQEPGRDYDEQGRLKARSFREGLEAVKSSIHDLLGHGDEGFEEAFKKRRELPTQRIEDLHNEVDLSPTHRMFTTAADASAVSAKKPVDPKRLRKDIEHDRFSRDLDMEVSRDLTKPGPYAGERGFANAFALGSAAANEASMGARADSLHEIDGPQARDRTANTLERAGLKPRDDSDEVFDDAFAQRRAGPVDTMRLKRDMDKDRALIKTDEHELAGPHGRTMGPQEEDFRMRRIKGSIDRVGARGDTLDDARRGYLPAKKGGR